MCVIGLILSMFCWLKGNKNTFKIAYVKSKLFAIKIKKICKTLTKSERKEQTYKLKIDIITKEKKRSTKAWDWQ